MKCCERDHNGDGNCDIHYAPGVLRMHATQMACKPASEAQTRRRATDSKVASHLEYGLEHQMDDGSIIQVVIWSSRAPDGYTMRHMAEALQDLDQCHTEMPKKPEFPPNRVIKEGDNAPRQSEC